MNTHPQSYFTKRKTVTEFADKYKQLCEQYKLQITSGINAINIDELDAATYNEEVDVATETYLDTVYETLV